MTYFILLLAAVGVINNLLINYMQKPAHHGHVQVRRAEQQAEHENDTD